MTSSTKKKRERKQDFQKPKLKVGKAKPKTANQTDTNFRAKAIVLNQQLAVEAPSVSSQFHHHVSLLSSRSDSQRRDSLAFLTTYVESANKIVTLPVSTTSLLYKLSPLILDGSNSVRGQLLKLFRSLPPGEIVDHVGKILPHVRAGMTHLSKDIRLSSVETLSWLIAVAGPQLVSSAGGWYKSLECFIALLGWRSLESGKWSSSSSTVADGKSTAKVMNVLAEFLEAGLLEARLSEEVDEYILFPTTHSHLHSIPSKSNAYGYLNLFGLPPDEKDQSLEDREDRFRVYQAMFAGPIEAGIESGKNEGGELGRAAGLLTKVLQRIDQQEIVD